MAPILDIKKLSYSYGNIKVVKEVDMYVNEGEMVTMIGANGAGKTTILRTISGLTEQAGTEGEIYFDGKNIAKMAAHKITALGLSQVLEGRHVFSKLSVTENLQIGAYLRHDAKGIEEDTRAVYKLFPRLEERKNQLAGTLSGGEQQMLAIARVMVARPKLILLDEPSLGLAPIIIREIFEAIKEINREGTTIMFVEQNSKIALATANRGYVIQTGEIIMSDTCENLAANEDVKKAYLGEE